MIDMEQCRKLFCLFAMLPDAEPYTPLLDAAAAQCMSMLRPDADASDLRLCYFCAALANLRYVQMQAARCGVSHTYAGTVARSHDAALPCSFAERLVQEYHAAAADLLTDRRLLLTGIG